MLNKKKKIIVLTGLIISSLLFLSISSLIKTEIEIPAKRFLPTMCYDEESDRVILYGGIKGGYLEEPQITYYFDTWGYNFNNNTWTTFEVTSSQRPWASMSDIAYDSESDKVVLFGGQKSERDPNGDETWICDFDEKKWTKVNPSSKPHIGLILGTALLVIPIRRKRKH